MFNQPTKSKWQRANSHYNVPKIKNFTKAIQNKYYLMGGRWNKTNLTFNDSALPSNQQLLAEDAINKINALGILHLTKTAKKANITIINKVLTDETELGRAETPKSDQPEYKNLDHIYTATIKINNNYIKQNAETNYNNYYEQNIAHELGHVFGLDHDADQSDNTMSAFGSPFTGTYKIDKDYITRLALLYQN
ncbi:hypothetical protein PT285_06885 [Lactobacillus sp. ESL0791]|uniref:reprolysin-like metallopeptidase n=1 Tax=Lactobacillus sp. ESL0791 TaxID=2983234 RepID=UPI0023F63EF5|nr:hypothetical protein [Lactobacillus sp. ESL0791]MDF7639125.1 hypothetical protein [Lactobacillus sp. ESL0791]